MRARIDGETVVHRRVPEARRAARPVRAAQDRDRRRPARAAAKASSAASPTRSRPRCSSPTASPRSRSSTPTASEAETLTFSQHLACPVCGTSYDEPAPRNFSFNSPYGACETCDGLGTTFEVDPELRHPRPRAVDQRRCDRPVAQRPHAVLHAHARVGRRASTTSTSTRRGRSSPPSSRRSSCTASNGKLTVKYKNRYGRTRQYSTEYEGVIPWIKRRHEGAESDWSREQYEGYMREVPCRPAAARG